MEISVAEKRELEEGLDESGKQGEEEEVFGGKREGRRRGRFR
jgi:hypothetical protein